MFTFSTFIYLSSFSLIILPTHISIHTKKLLTPESIWEIRPSFATSPMLFSSQGRLYTTDLCVTS